TIALAAAVCFSASAAGRQLATTTALNVKSTSIEAPVKAKAHKLPAKAAALAEGGEYIWSYYGLLQNQGADQVGNVVLTITDAATGAATIEGIPSGRAKNVSATVDLAAGTVTIANNQDLGPDANGDATYFYLKDLDSEGKLVEGMSKAASCVGTFTETGIVFDPTLVWATGDPSMENLGWWALTALNQFVDPATIVDPWEEYGKAQFTENIISPLFTKEPVSPYEVMVYRNTETPTIYKVENPLKGLYTALGWTEPEDISPDMELDATDPSNIIMPITASGISTQADGHVVYFSASYYHNMTAEEGEAFNPALAITLKKEGNKETFTFPEKSCFAMGATSGSLYYASPAVSTLVITTDAAGIEDVVAEDNAPVEFFNLQGVRVANPENGVFIRRQGATVSKVLVK
ncbi:MAG: hypothetical protein NC453_30485, partial [Muribaculum sp.]|nr:hypothetical protein [Muribaculum sp.]